MLKFYLVLIIGASISFILYACIIVGRQADREFENEEVSSEWRKQS